MPDADGDLGDDRAIEELGVQPLGQPRPTGTPAAPNWREIVTDGHESARGASRP